ncbi:nitrogen regulation protein NR(II) [uncultured Shewanella sp.]|uniref:nitrogen regulation protein NR(II) n=1 Tax=uncultured Shewanella sp. TaxID=173975 RepID=UPI002611AF73|nr:nitrogen regulation protein NR(II) [uncultured Shewanella sp.]
MDSHRLLNHLVTAIVVIDHELHLLYANTAAKQLFKISHNRLFEHALTEHYKSIGIDPQLWRNAINNHQGLTINSVSLTTLDGKQHTLDISLSPIEEEKSAALLELRLVDQQQRIHQQLSQDAQQQAAQFLVRNLAHEIKNPLAGIRGAAQLLSRELVGSTQNDFTDLIIEQADRLRNLVDRLLGPQRPSEHGIFNIHEIIQKVLSLIAITLPENIHIQQDYDPSIPNLKMDSEQLQQALLNIVQNAVQALQGKPGKITLQTRTQHQVTIGNHRHKLVLALSVTDNGPGINPDLIDTLFYPMVTDKENGSGLGLSIAHNIARLHGGRIDCHSSQSGTQFILLLPVTPQSDK